MTTNLISLAGNNIFADSQVRGLESERRALEFFARAELSNVLQSIWDSIKYLPMTTVLKLLKAVALVAAVILLTQSISVTGVLALAAAIAGLVFAAISNALVWIIYIPLFFVRTPEFTMSIVLAIGLAWLGGVSPFFALVFSPLILFGSRLLEHSQWAQQSVSTIAQSVASDFERADLGTAIRKASADITGFIGYYLR